MIKRHHWELIAVLVLAAVPTSSPLAFELKYLDQTGTVLDYSLKITRDNEATSVDVQRRVDSNQGGVLTITTAFANGQSSRGGIVTLIPGMDGTNLRTVMDEHGVVSSVTPLGDFAATLNSLNLAVDRDLWHSLGISSFPAGDRAVGDSWTKSASGGNLFTYRIAEEGLSLSGYSSVVRIHITSTIELDNRQEVFKARKSFYSRGRIGFTGDIYFDVDVGRIVRQAVSLNTHVLTVVVDLDGTPQISHDEGVTNVELTIQ